MRFEFEGSKYSLKFYRLHRPSGNSHFPAPVNGEEDKRPRRMYTTVEILKWSSDDPDAPKSVFRTATISVWHREPNATRELGRIRALRQAVKGRVFWNPVDGSLDKDAFKTALAKNLERSAEFKGKLFHAYFTRPRPISVLKDKEAEKVEKQA